ncbi:MAG TPA: hypothetical protein VGV17_14365 [Bosea sp. (in: a-proteobacteria)]|uniref:hypothetical protein n=1 Tax=Bosea sp. (in: a-proteobacteria) TaxID=1871050 RepID=UPI002DDD4990|nr:hypothetical protein [Bosea sp. (in: a-proteobacteria)]HEV2554937.1 hypothetical protein [Bosea sp. (in: a-proteobacteria)]
MTSTIEPGTTFRQIVFAGPPFDTAMTVNIAADTANVTVATNEFIIASPDRFARQRVLRPGVPMCG